MKVPPLYRQLMEQLCQWSQPKDPRHLQGFAEAVAAILASQSACLGEWIPYMGHRGCQARSHMSRLSYLLHNPAMSAERFYQPLLQWVLQGWADSALTLTLDTSVLWDQFCLVEVCLAWGGRSLTLAQQVLEHGSATVAFEDYQALLETAEAMLPPGCTVTLLADRGFEHRKLLHWLQHHGWDWVIRVKSDLRVTWAGGLTSVDQLLPPAQQAYLFNSVWILGDIKGHLATAHWPDAGEPWAVFSSLTPSLQTFARYGERFGGIEPHFKDYKSAAFNVLQSGLRQAQALTCLVMLLDSAALIAMILGMMLEQWGQRSQLDWHGQRGLSFLQLGLRDVARRCYEHAPLPALMALPRCNPPPACASMRKRLALDYRIEFSKVLRFS